MNTVDTTNPPSGSPSGLQPAPETQLTHIHPSRGLPALNLRDLWRHRELLYFLTWRDVKVRYKQTALGASWAILQPFLTMVVFTIFFGRLANIPSDGVPYPIFSYAGLLPWLLFANSMQTAGNSLVLSQNLITKVYFPRLVIPISAVLSGLIDFAIAFVVLIGMMIYYKIDITWTVLMVPLLLVLALATSLGVGLWLSALNVKYRDVRYVIPFLTQFWLFLTPVAYPASMVPEELLPLYGLNPMAGVVEGFRWALLGTDAISGSGLFVVSVVVVIVMLSTGFLYFRRFEQTFADIV